MQKRTQSNLLNSEYKDVILKNGPCAFSHGAANGYIGFGMLYYSIVYILRAKVAVCLGSGEGFVSRIMRQAQQDLGIAKDSRTILVDANAFPGTHLPDVELVTKTTKEAAEIFRAEKTKINYLHINANHSLEEALLNYEEYRSLMSNQFIITIYDAQHPSDIAKAIEQIRLKDNVEVIDFDYLGYGLAMVKPKFATKTVATLFSKAVAFIKHPVPHTSIRLQKMIHNCIAMIKKTG